MARFLSFWPFRPLRLALLGMLVVAATAGRAAGTPMTLQLKWYHNFQFAGYYAADAQGYYRAAGLDVRIKEGSPTIHSVEEVLSGRAQFGVTDASLLLARAKGEPVVALGVVFQHSPEVLLVHLQKLGPGLDDLAGKRVMVGETDPDVLAFLRKKALPPERLVIVPHSFNVQDLIEGRVDAMSAYSIDQPYYLDRIGFPYQIFSPRAEGIDFYGDTLFTDEKELKAHPEAVKAFRAASMRGWQYAMAHREEMVNLILSRYPRQWNRAQLLFEADQMVPLLQPELVEMGYMNPERWKRIAETFASLGMLPQGFALEGFLYQPRQEMDLRWMLWFVGILMVLGAAIFTIQSYRSNARFRAIFNAANDAIFIHDLVSGAILDVNQRTTEMYGYTRNEIRVLPFEALCGGVPPHTPEEAHGWMRKAAAGPPQVFEWMAKDSSSHLFWVEVNMRRTTINGHGRLVVSVRDIAERKAAEGEKARLQGQLVQSQKMESLGLLAGGVAHDMNNVLGAILTLASTKLDKQQPGSPEYRTLATICQAATRGGQMVQGLLKFARQAPSTMQDLDANELLQDVANLLAHTTLAKIGLNVDLAPDLRPICGDASALTHAFMNLCVNSIDAMDGKGFLTLTTRNLDEGRIEVTFEDTGCGMPQEVLARAMEPFFTTKPVGKGTGLGLSIVYATVVAHQGQMDIQAEPGKGTRITLILPTCAPGEPQLASAPDSSKAPDGPALDILLVDDDDFMREAIQQLLQTLGHSFRAVASGEEALIQLEQGPQPDLVILDLNMPGLGGKGTLPRLRVLYPTLPVFLATGRANQEALDLVAAHPYVTLLPKPFSFEDLRARLQQGVASRPRDIFID